MRLAHVDELPERCLEFQQLIDPEILKLSKDLEIRDYNKFELIDGLVYRKDNDGSKVMIPEAMIVNILRAYHEMAHAGPEKTLQGIKQNFSVNAKKSL